MAPSPLVTAIHPRVHVPALDGLRGLAILAVMFYHFNLVVEETYRPFDGSAAALARSGWCGVDLFFVLSGFLITGILLDAKGAPHYFGNFYARRALRILPLYYGLLAVVFLAGPRIPTLATPKFEALAQNQLPLWLYYSNFTIAWRSEWPFDAEWIELNHFWSLAIEEQFYLVWPAVVLTCSRRTLTVVCVTLFAVALLVRGAFVLHGDHAFTVYTLTPCRWDGLALGGLLALASRTPGWWATLARPARVLAVACFLVLAGLAIQGNGLKYENASVHGLGFSVLALFFGALLILAVQADRSSIAGRVWSHPILRFFGKYSYGLYVVHPTVMEQVAGLVPLETWVEWSGAPAMGALSYSAASLCLSVAVAWLCWHLYEKHFLKLKRRFEVSRPRTERTPAKNPPVLLESSSRDPAAGQAAQRDGNDSPTFLT